MPALDSYTKQQDNLTPTDISDLCTWLEHEETDATKAKIIDLLGKILETNSDTKVRGQIYATLDKMKGQSGCAGVDKLLLNKSAVQTAEDKAKVQTAAEKREDADIAKELFGKDKAEYTEDEKKAIKYYKGIRGKIKEPKIKNLVIDILSKATESSFKEQRIESVFEKINETLSSNNKLENILKELKKHYEESVKLHKEAKGKIKEEQTKLEKKQGRKATHAEIANIAKKVYQSMQSKFDKLYSTTALALANAGASEKTINSIKSDYTALASRYLFKESTLVNNAFKEALQIARNNDINQKTEDIALSLQYERGMVNFTDTSRSAAKASNALSDASAAVKEQQAVMKNLLAKNNEEMSELTNKINENTKKLNKEDSKKYSDKLINSINEAKNFLEQTISLRKLAKAENDKNLDNISNSKAELAIKYAQKKDAQELTAIAARARSGYKKLLEKTEKMTAEGKQITKAEYEEQAKVTEAYKNELLRHEEKSIRLKQSEEVKALKDSVKNLTAIAGPEALLGIDEKIKTLDEFINSKNIITAAEFNKYQEQKKEIIKDIEKVLTKAYEQKPNAKLIAIHKVLQGCLPGSVEEDKFKTQLSDMTEEEKIKKIENVVKALQEGQSVSLDDLEKIVELVKNNPQLLAKFPELASAVQKIKEDLDALESIKSLANAGVEDKETIDLAEIKNPIIQNKAAEILADLPDQPKDQYHISATA